MKKNWYFMVLAFFMAMSMCVFSSCSNDDDEDGNISLGGTKWEVIASDDNEDDFESGIITFEKNGNVKFTPDAGWTYAKWECSGSTLKLILGEDDEPDDYVLGTFTIKGKTATYVYSLYDYVTGSKFSGPHTITLKKK